MKKTLLLIFMASLACTAIAQKAVRADSITANKKFRLNGKDFRNVITVISNTAVHTDCPTGKAVYDFVTGLTYSGDVSGPYNNLQLGAGVVGTSEIASGAVTGAKIAQMGATTRQVLKWNGSTWAPANDSIGGGGGGGSLPAKQVGYGTGSGITSDGSFVRSGTTLSLNTSDTTGTFNVYNTDAATKYSLRLPGNQQNIAQIPKDTRASSVQISNFDIVRSFQSSASTAGDNQVVSMGYNVSPGGGLEDTSKSSISIRFENNFRNSSGEARSFEFHIPDIRYNNGQSRRPLSGFFSNNQNKIQGNWGMTTDFLAINDFKTNTSKVVWGIGTNSGYAKGLSFFDTCRIAFDKNNTPIMQQRNAAGSAYIDLPKVDNTDRILIGGTSESGVAAYNKLQITNGGNLWNENGAIIIGKSGQLNQLSIYNSAIMMSWGTTYGTDKLYQRIDGNDWDINYPTGGTYPMFFDIRAPTYSFRVNNSGDIGFGTYSPLAKIHAITTGGASTKMFRMENTAAISDLFVSNSTPEGAISATRGSMVFVDDGTNGNAYIKQNGTGNTGYGVIATGIEKGSLKAYSLTRNLPTTVGQVLNFAIVNMNGGSGAGYVDLTVVAQDNSNTAIVKNYKIAITVASGGGAWQIVSPLISTPDYLGLSDFVLEKRSTGTTDSLRLRRTAGTTSCGVAIKIQFDSYGTTDNITTLNTTTSASAITAVYPFTPICGQNKVVGINTVTPAYALDINSTDALRLPRGTDAQRPTGAEGVFRQNTSIHGLEVYDGTQYKKLNSTLTPTASIQSGAGSGATSSVTGNDMGFQVTLITGSASLASGTQFIITYGGTFSSTPYPVFSSSGTNTPAAISTFYTDSESTTGFNFKTNTALNPSTTYKINFNVKQ